METYLLTWNPSEYQELYQDYKAWKEGKLPKLWWATCNKSTPVGSRVFVIRLAEEPKGIIASGKTVGPVHPEYSERAGKEVDAVDVTFDRFYHPDAPLISLERLQQIRDQLQGLWTHQASGVKVPEELTDELERLWSISGLTSVKGDRRKIQTRMLDSVTGGIVIYHADDWTTTVAGERNGDAFRNFGEKVKDNPQQKADFDAWKKANGLENL